MRSVVERLGEVRRAAGESWCHGDAIEEWASPFGTDLQSAWNACERGDYLAALTSLVDFDPAVLLREVVRAARGLVELEPEHDDAFAKLVARIERSRAVPLNVLEEAEQLAATLRSIEEVELANERAHRPAMIEALSMAIRAAGEGTTAIAEEERLASIQRQLEASFATLPDLQRLREFHRARHRRTARAFALRALLAALSFTQLVPNANTSASAGREGCSRTFTGSGNTSTTRILHRLAAHAADFFHHAALARTWAIGASESGWSAGLRGLCLGCIEAFDAVRLGDGATLRRMWVEFAFALSDHMEGIARAVLAAYAVDLRRAGEPCPLVFYAPERETIPVGPSREACVGGARPSVTLRDELREDLDWLARLARRLGSSALLEALGVAQVMLGAPGPLDPSKVARVMMTVHARFVELMTARANTLDDPHERTLWNDIRDTLDARFQRMVDENAERNMHSANDLN